MSDRQPTAPNAIVPDDLPGLTARFLRHCVRDARFIEHALANGKLEVARRLAHQLHGAGSAYGFATVSHESARIEAASRIGDGERAQRACGRLLDHLATLEACAGQGPGPGPRAS
jgi:HPt (histidine-containing phosphotransfer) domain-containing protein